MFLSALPKAVARAQELVRELVRELELVVQGPVVQEPALVVPEPLELERLELERLVVSRAAWAWGRLALLVSVPRWQALLQASSLPQPVETLRLTLLSRRPLR